MDSKTYIRSFALFMFQHSKGSKESTMVISELYPGLPLLSRLLYGGLPNSEKKTSHSNTSAHWVPSNP